MAVFIDIDVPGQTQEGYDGMLAVLAGPLQQAKGFIAHGAWPNAGGWGAFEIWETSEEAAEFFAKYIQPKLPPGIKPKRTVLEMHSLLRA